MFILSGVFWVVGLAVTIVVGLVVYLTPALFQLCVYLEWQAALAVEQVTGRSLAHGPLILLSLVGWGGAGALLGALLLGGWLGVGPALVFGVVFALWGASVGHQAALRLLVVAMRRPGFLPHQTPGEAYRFPPDEWVVGEDEEGVHWAATGGPDESFA